MVKARKCGRRVAVGAAVAVSVELRVVSTCSTYSFRTLTGLVSALIKRASNLQLLGRYAISPHLDRSEVDLGDVARMALTLRTIKISPTKAPGGPVVTRVATRNHQLQNFWSAPKPTTAIRPKKTIPWVKPKIRTNSSLLAKEATRSTISSTRSARAIHRTTINQRSTW